jgi:glycosyltransferase involved in cell wall biosynthesis
MKYKMQKKPRPIEPTEQKILFDEYSEKKYTLGMATYNRPEYLKATFETLLASDLSFVKDIIILDDCSTDVQTLKLIKDFINKCPIKTRFYKNKENMGANKSTFIIALEAFKNNDLLILLGSDSKFHRNWLIELDNLKTICDKNYINYGYLTVFNTPAHRTMYQIDENICLKRDIGSFASMFQKDIFFKLAEDAELMKVKKSWDWLYGYKCDQLNKLILSTKKTYVQHTGISGTNSSVKCCDIGEGFVEHDNKLYDIIIVTPFYKREKLFKLFLKELSKNRADGVNLHAILIGSNTIEDEKKLVESYGFEYVHAPNRPLSNKWNEGISKLRKYNFKYCTILGSDDFIDSKLLKRLISEMDSGEYDVGGIEDCYIHDMSSKKTIHWSGYPEGHERHGETVGCGRFYRNSIIEQFKYKLWSDGKNSGLDRNITNKTKDFKMLKTKLLTDEYMVDIKSMDEQITKFAAFVELCTETLNKNEGLTKLSQEVENDGK